MEWGAELEEQYRKYELDNPYTSTLVKRPAGSRQKAAGEPPAKKVKSGGGGGGMNDVKSHYQNGTLNKLTVATLKDFCQMNSLSLAGKKADLVARVEEYLDSK